MMNEIPPIETQTALKIKNTQRILYLTMGIFIILPFILLWFYEK